MEPEGAVSHMCLPPHPDEMPFLLSMEAPNDLATETVRYSATRSTACRNHACTGKINAYRAFSTTLRNGIFERWTTGRPIDWTVGGSCATSDRRVSKGDTGSRTRGARGAAEVTSHAVTGCANTSKETVLSQMREAKPGWVHRAVVFVRLEDGGDDGAARIEICPSDRSGSQPVALKCKGTTGSDLGTGWVRFETAYEMPANATHATVRLVTKGPAGGRDVHWDDAAFYAYAP